jgi:hypothetical protein
VVENVKLNNCSSGYTYCVKLNNYSSGCVYCFKKKHIVYKDAIHMRFSFKKIDVALSRIALSPIGTLLLWLVIS